MLLDLQEIAPHMLGVFMIALACIPLVFVWQDRGRKQADQDRVAKLRQEARLTARLRSREEAGRGLAGNWMGGAGR
jgi:nicotinamide riboside transporter PnuC